MKTKLLRASDVVQGVAIAGIILTMAFPPVAFDLQTRFVVAGSIGSGNTIIQTVLWVWRNCLGRGEQG